METKPVAWIVTDGSWKRAYVLEEAADNLIEGSKKTGCKPLWKIPLYEKSS